MSLNETGDMRFAGARGKLIQWTCEDGTILRSQSDVEHAMRLAGERGDAPTTGLPMNLGQGNGWLDFELLCDIADHLDQPCILIEAFPDRNPGPTLHIRFDDGYMTYALNTDARFD